jgi:hypothetical protein
LFLIVSALSRNPTHVPVSFPRIPARESLSLACARESNQREHTLAAAVAGLLPGDFARTLRRFADRPSVA